MGDAKFTALPPDGSDKLGSSGSKPGRHCLECVGAEFDTGQEMTGSCTQVAYGDRAGMLHPIMEVGAAYRLSPRFTQLSELHASDVAGLRSGAQNGGRLDVSASGAKLALGLA